MPDPTTAWQYSESVGPARREALAQLRSFDDLIGKVVDDVRVIRAIADPGRARGLTDCIQAVFFIELPTTGDMIFNGPHGYRAQYWIDPWQGLAKNAQIIRALKPKLLAAVDIDDQPNLGKIDVCASLEATSAKFWIREGTSTVGGRRDLNVEPWVSEAERGVELALLGLAAPEVTKFEVKGAFLDPYGNERIPARKVRRHYDIHYYGFA